MKILKKIFQSAQLVAFYTHESLLDLFSSGVVHNIFYEEVRDTQ